MHPFSNICFQTFYFSFPTYHFFSYLCTRLCMYPQSLPNGRISGRTVSFHSEKTGWS